MSNSPTSASRRCRTARFAPMSTHCRPRSASTPSSPTTITPTTAASTVRTGWRIYFNSERASTAPGHAQLFRMHRDGSDVQQLTFDDRVNWFPHPSPDGRRLLYLSFPAGTLGHPPDLTVRLRLIENGRTRDLVELPGGQGTINVPSWAPDGSGFAYVAYPFG